MNGSLFPRNRKLALSALAVLASGTLAAGLAPARGHGEGCKHRGGGLERLEKKVEKLELDDATRASTAELFERAGTELQTLREQKRAAREVLREQMAQEPVQLEALMAQTEEVGAIRTEIDKLRLRTRIELRGLLGPERWAELEAMKKPHRHGRSDPKS